MKYNANNNLLNNKKYLILVVELQPKYITVLIQISEISMQLSNLRILKHTLKKNKDINKLHNV